MPFQDRSKSPVLQLASILATAMALLQARLVESNCSLFYYPDGRRRCCELCQMASDLLRSRGKSEVASLK